MLEPRRDGRCSVDGLSPAVSALITVSPDQEAIDHADSVSYAVPSVDLGVVPYGDDPAVGEMVARRQCDGRLLKPAGTTPSTIIDGWLHTGDIARVDDVGRVHIIDRLKDIINRGGENVSSVEVEAVLLSAFRSTSA